MSEYCKKNKVLSIGLSDTSNLSGALDFSEKISKSGSQPIIGSQIKFKFKDKIGLIPLLAKNVDGYKNLIEISSKSFLTNKGIDEPHCDLEDLFLYKDGIIVFSGGLKSPSGDLFNKANFEDLEVLYKLFKKFFRKLYIEIQRHNDLNEKEFEKFNLSTSEKLQIQLSLLMKSII